MELNVSITTGAFTVGEVITGSTSGATYEYQIVAATNADDVLVIGANAIAQVGGSTIVDKVGGATTTITNSAGIGTGAGSVTVVA